MTNAVSPSIFSRKDSMLPKGENVTLSTSGWKDFLYFGLNVNDNAPIDFP